MVCSPELLCSKFSVKMKRLQATPKHNRIVRKKKKKIRKKKLKIKSFAQF